MTNNNYFAYNANVHAAADYVNLAAAIVAKRTAAFAYING